MIQKKQQDETVNILSKAKKIINKSLGPFNIKIESLKAEKTDQERLLALAKKDHFNKPVFPLLPAFTLMQPHTILKSVRLNLPLLKKFEKVDLNPVKYTFDNPWFTSPDAEVLYTIVTEFRPGHIVEVGSGNSTKIIRQAIMDKNLNSYLIAIDPNPRTDVSRIVDELHQIPLEQLEEMEILYSLKKEDILFIDSSHEIKTGNDVILLYLNIFPKLPPGVLIHIHDIFLPYDYPEEWIIEKGWQWNEQYLLQALLMFNDTFEVLWAGHFLQRTMSDFGKYFPHLNGRIASSLWLRKVR